MRKLEPLSAAIMYVLSSTAPGEPPVTRVSEIVAGGKLHVADPSTEYVNFTGTTPRFAVKTLEPLALIGCWIWATVNGQAIAKSLNDFPVPVTVGSVPTVFGAGSKKLVTSKTNWLSSPWPVLYGNTL